MYKPLMILVAAMLILGVVAPAVSAGSQNWYFTSDDASAPIYTGTPSVDYHRIMTKGVEGDDIVITLEPGQRVWFYADELAAGDVTFLAGKWDVAYWVKALNESEAGNGSVYTGVCYVNADGKYKRIIKRGSESITDPQNIEEIKEELDAKSFTVSEGGRLAVEVYWGSNPNGNLEICCNPSDKHASNMTSPSSDPGYPASEIPIPEFTTIATPIAVVLGLIFLYHRRKQKS